MRAFEEAFEGFRDHEENGYVGEMENLFGLYENEVRLWKEQQEQYPIDTRDFTNENPGESLTPLTPPGSLLGDHQRDYESLRLPSEAKHRTSQSLRDPAYETFEYENPRASAALQEPSCEEYTL